MPRGWPTTHLCAIFIVVADHVVREVRQNALVPSKWSGLRPCPDIAAVLGHGSVVRGDGVAATTLRTRTARLVLQLAARWRLAAFAMCLG